MTKGQFDDLFLKAKLQLAPKSKEEIEAKIAEYAEDVHHIKTEELTSFVMTESIKYTNDLVYILLSEIAVEK